MGGQREAIDLDCEACASRWDWWIVHTCSSWLRKAPSARQALNQTAASANRTSLHPVAGLYSLCPKSGCAFFYLGVTPLAVLTLPAPPFCREFSEETLGMFGDCSVSKASVEASCQRMERQLRSQSNTVKVVHQLRQVRLQQHWSSSCRERALHTLCIKKPIQHCDTVSTESPASHKVPARHAQVLAEQQLLASSAGPSACLLCIRLVAGMA